MSDLGWRADGIMRARAAGGVELEVYRKPGFQSQLSVRRSSDGGTVSGFAVEASWFEDPEPDEFRKPRERAK